MRSIQEQYVPDWQHCFGCGPQNTHGFRLASHWSGEAAIATFQPRQQHCAAPGYLYGGIIAALIDCHSIATAAAAAHQAAGADFHRVPLPRFVTGSLHVRYVQLTPMDRPLTLRAHAVEHVRRKVAVRCELLAGDHVCAQGDVIAIAVADSFLADAAR